MTERYTHRERLLSTAADLVTKQRNKSYGEPDEDFQRIAAIASAMGFRFLKTVERPDGNTSEFMPLDGSDVALFMIALKASRLAWNREHEDSWTDMAGYAACGYETAILEAERRKDATPVADFVVAVQQIAPDLLTPQMRSLGEMALSGNPAQLEGRGFILINAPHMMTCGPECNSGHLFIDGCQWRIQRRRTS